MPEEKGDEQISYVKEAFRWQYNWIPLAGATAFALVSASGLPLILAAGLELIYLSTVPHNKRFQRLVRSWKYAEEKRAHERKLNEIFRELPAEMRSRYADLAATSRDIRANYDRLSSTSQIFVEQTQDKLEGLMQSYLRLLYAAFQHREYLRTTDPNSILREQSQLQHALDAEPPKVQEINRRRIEILNKRLEKYQKVRENREIIDAQCAAIEDVLKLIRDQSVTMRDPQELSDHLENLMRDVGETEENVRQVEAIYAMGSAEMTGALAPLPSADSPGPRTETRRRVHE
jgi:hypothetical protein